MGHHTKTFIHYDKMEINHVQKTEQGRYRSGNNDAIETLLKLILREEKVNVTIEPKEGKKKSPEIVRGAYNKTQRAFQKLTEHLHVGFATITDEKIEFDDNFSASEKIRGEISQALKEYKKAYIDKPMDTI